MGLDKNKSDLWKICVYEKEKVGRGSKVYRRRHVLSPTHPHYLPGGVSFHMEEALEGPGETWGCIHLLYDLGSL